MVALVNPLPSEMKNLIFVSKHKYELTGHNIQYVYWLFIKRFQLSSLRSYFIYIFETHLKSINFDLTCRYRRKLILTPLKSAENSVRDRPMGPRFTNNLDLNLEFASQVLQTRKLRTLGKHPICHSLNCKKVIYGLNNNRNSSLQKFIQYTTQEFLWSAIQYVIIRLRVHFSHFKLDRVHSLCSQKKLSTGTVVKFTSLLDYYWTFDNIVTIIDRTNPSYFLSVLSQGNHFSMT